DRRTDVRFTAHGRDPHGAHPPKARAQQPGGARCKRDPTNDYGSEGSSSSDNALSSSSQPTKATSTPPVRPTRPAGGSTASRRIVITTSRSCHSRSGAHIGQVTDLTR